MNKILFKSTVIATALATTCAAFAAEDNPKFSNWVRDISWVAATSPKNSECDFSKVPGTVIAHSPKSTGIFLGSPSILVMPDGAYIASHDLFGRNWDASKGSATLVYRSEDKGKTWKQIARVNNQNWCALFNIKNDLYIIGCGIPEYIFSVRKSTDGGYSWTDAKDEKTGGIVKGNACSTNPMPIAVANGRIYVSAELGHGHPQGWCDQNSFVMSAPIDSNLLDAANWTQSSMVEIPKGMAGSYVHNGWLEGNMVHRRSDNKVFNILRTHGMSDELAAFYEVSADGKTAILNPKDMFIRMPGACKKFYIVYDEKSQTYFAVSNWTLECDRGKVSNCPHPIKAERTRNTLAISRSKNLIDWEVYTVLLHNNDIDHGGYQYPTAAIDGDDMLLTVRTAFPDAEGPADSQHNSNYIIFLKVENFRNRTFKTVPFTGKIKAPIYPY